MWGQRRRLEQLVYKPRSPKDCPQPGKAKREAWSRFFSSRFQITVKHILTALEVLSLGERSGQSSLPGTINLIFLGDNTAILWQFLMQTTAPEGLSLACCTTQQFSSFGAQRIMRKACEVMDTLPFTVHTNFWLSMSGRGQRACRSNTQVMPMVPDLSTRENSRSSKLCFSNGCTLGLPVCVCAHA